MKKNNNQKRSTTFIAESKTSNVGEIRIKSDDTHITIWYSDMNDGYMYNIYNQEPTEDLEPLDGGICTGTIINAIEMAMSQAGMCTGE